MPLLAALRGELGMTGVRFGCGAGLCGACNVLIEGRVATSCNVAVGDVAGKAIVTVGGSWHARRAASAAEGIPRRTGRAMRLLHSRHSHFRRGLLRHTPKPTDAEVRAALDGNLCRCGSHNRIVRAVLAAAGEGAPDERGGEIARQSATNPMLSRWIRLRPEGVVEICPGKVEIGQGILTALAQLAADELDVGLERIRMVPANTWASPNEGMTSGSLSIQDSGMAVRQACAEARAILLSAAAERLGVPVETLSVEDGVIRGAGNLSPAISIWPRTACSTARRPGTSHPKAVSQRRLAGKPVDRLDLADKIFGAARFVHDLILPAMLHGRVLRPPSPGAKLLTLKADDIRAMPGVKAVVRDGSFAGCRRR